MLKIITKYIKKVEVIETSTFGIKKTRDVFYQEVEEEIKGDEAKLASIIEEFKTK